MSYVNQEEVYKQTNAGLTVFEHFFQGVDFSNPKHFFKIRPDEKTASARVHPYKDLWRITDFGDKSKINGLPAIPFVMQYCNLSFIDAIRYIEDVVLRRKINGGAFKSKANKADYEAKQPGPNDKQGEYSFIFKRKFENHDLKAFGRYVTPEVLKKYKCKPVAEYQYNGTNKKTGKPVIHCFKSNPDYPIFLFDYGSFKKLYKPYEDEKRYRFVYIDGDKKPKDYVFGLEQVRDANNEFVTNNPEDETPAQPPKHKKNAVVKELFRCSGESDAINLASLGYHVYWLNSETEELSYEQFKKIDDLCERHYQIMDLDQTGHREALKNALEHYSLYTIELPKWIKKYKDWRGNPCKDLKDYINIAGGKQEQTEYQFSVLKANARSVRFWEKIIEKKKVNYNINMEFFYFFLKANGFYQMESIYHKKAGYCYVHVQGKVVHLIHPDNIKRIIKRFTKEWIQKKHIKEGIKLLNKINTSNQISEANLETIEEIKLEFRNHDQHNEYIHFNNGSLHITRNSIRSISHDEVPNHILGSLEVNKNTISHVCDHNIRQIYKSPIEVVPSPKYQELLDQLHAAKNTNEREYINFQINNIEDIDRYEIVINDEDFIFGRFLQDLSRIHWQQEEVRTAELKRQLKEKTISKQEYEEQLKDVLTNLEKKEQNLALANLLFVMGYHCQQYKDPGKPWQTFLQDMKISEIGEASGRSGKSLYSKAPTFVRASFYKGGRSLNDNSAFQFFYDGFTEFHDYIEVDDLGEFVDMGWFYTQITGNREINPKNYAPFTLDYKDSGKMLISSNYELQNVNSSTIARMLNSGVSDYYHEQTKYNNYKETRTPFNKFGRLLYDDFTEEEWNKFYNLMAYCIQLNMRFHKIQPPMLNLEKRQARRKMTQGLGKDEVFLAWADDYFIPYTDNVEPKPETSPDDIGYFNTYILKDNAFENFVQRLSKKQRADYHTTKFKKHVEAFCEYYGYELNPEHVPGCLDGRILKSFDGKTRECFYISTAKINLNGHPQPKIHQPAPETEENEPPF